jgi:hypothetical protein
MLRPDVEDAMRVGVRVVIVAAAVALLVLVLTGSARSAEPATGMELVEQLLDDAPVTSREHAAAAEGLLQEQRRARRQQVGQRALELGIRAGLQASPRRLLKTARKVVRDLWRLDEPGPAEDRALQLLAPEVRSERADPATLELYQRLETPERSTRIANLARDVDTALGAGDAHRARRGIAQLRRLAPDSEEITRLDAALRDYSSEMPGSDAVHAQHAELALAAALLAEHDARVLSIPANTPEARLGQAVARYSLGDRPAALEQLAELSEFEGRTGETARVWLEDPAVHPERELDRLWSDLRTRRLLGRIGGEQLARDGRELSRDGYRAWKDTATPLNLAVSLPARWAGNWSPDTRDYRTLAHVYLQEHPEGERADEVRARLAELGGDVGTRFERAFDDGRLQLPSPQRQASTVRAQRSVIVSAAVLERLGSDIEAEGADWIRLSVRPRTCRDSAERRGKPARLLLDALAEGLETEDFVSASRASDALETLRSIDSRLGSGARLCVAAAPSTRPEIRALRQALLEGGAARAPGSVDVHRGGEDVRFERRWHARECPADSVCIDRVKRLDGSLYARVDTDGNVRLGARTQLQGASLSLELGRSGPRAHLVVPVNRWLGLGGWLPLEAAVDASLDGVSFAPRAVSR